MTTSITSSSQGINRYLSRKWQIVIGWLLFFMVLCLVLIQMYQAQPTKIIIDSQGLSDAEYRVLNQAVAGYIDNSFFNTSLLPIQDEVLKQKWISQVNIKRKWREGIVVTALPRVAVARFGSEHLIDAQGEVFKPIDESQLTQPDLIMLHGDSEQSYLIMQQMQQINQWFAPLELKVADLILTPRMTWIIKFEGGLRIIVDNERTSQKLVNVSQLLANQLSDRRDDIASLDLRYKNGFVIAWKQANTTEP